MKRLVIALGAAWLSIVAFSEGNGQPAQSDQSAITATQKPKKLLTPEERAQRTKALKEKMLKKTGGFVIKKNSSRGNIYVVSQQDTVPVDVLQRPIAYMRKFTKLPVRLAMDRKYKYEGLPTEEDVRKTGADFALFVRDDPESLTKLLIAPENRWAYVNVARLRDDKPEDAVFHMRVRKEVNRGLALLCGCFDSQYPNTLIGPIANYAALDRFDGEDFPPDVFPAMINYMRGYGVTPYVEATYLRACKDGWAEAPTNEIQKAIWDKVHEVPMKPIKIEYNEKRDKGK